MKLFLDTNDDYKNADQSHLEILTPSAFAEKYLNVEL